MACGEDRAAIASAPAACMTGGLVLAFAFLAAAVTAASHLGPEELETLLAHVRSCKPATRLPEARGVEAVLKHFDLRRTDERE